MGNPHLVLFCRTVELISLERVGPMIELDKAFPQRVNAHFVRALNRSEVTMRTWERGSGATLACGTGAAATCAVGAALGRTDRAILAHLPGGDLALRWDEQTDHVLMTGPAVELFRGVWRDG
jgi:diaminopimelate epimerase